MKIYTDKPEMLPAGHFPVNEPYRADVILAFSPGFLREVDLYGKPVLLAAKRAPLSLVNSGLDVKIVNPADLSDVLTCWAIRKSARKEKGKKVKTNRFRSNVLRKKRACALLAASFTAGLVPGVSVAANKPVSLQPEPKPAVVKNGNAHASAFVPDKNEKPVWPTAQEKVIGQYGFDSECNYHAAATLAASAGEPVKAVFGGVVVAVYGDSVTVDSNGVELTYGNLTPTVALNTTVHGGGTLALARSDITLAAKKGGMLFDPVASFWPDLSRFAAQKKEQEEVAVQMKAVKENAAQKRAKHMKIGMRPPDGMEQIFKNAARVYGVDVDLLKAVAIEESGFDPTCTSSKGAMGVMQLLPGTAADQGVTAPYDVAQNIYGGARYLKEQLLRFNGDLACALAAYNAGPEAVVKYKGVPPYAENYVRVVIAQYNALKGESR